MVNSSVEVDKKVGTILIPVLEEQTVPENPKSKDKKQPWVTASSELECRYVYASEECDGKPYYLTRTQNRVFVVDQSRINFFPRRGVVPEGVLGRVKDFRQIYEKVPPKPVGLIMIQVPTRENDKITFVEQKRDVYCEEKGDNGDGVPFYYTLCGTRKLKVDKERVCFLKIGTIPDGMPSN